MGNYKNTTKRQFLSIGHHEISKLDSHVSYNILDLWYLHLIYTVNKQLLISVLTINDGQKINTNKQYTFDSDSHSVAFLFVFFH